MMILLTRYTPTFIINKNSLFNAMEIPMAECTLLAKCLFFNDKMASMPAAADMMKKKFCLKDSATCSRFMVCSALGREAVPTDLFPNHVERAQSIIAKGK
jgi:hypothetical protein